MPKDQKARSPSHAVASAPYNTSMSTPLPKSVEQQYRKKCIELKKRIRELELYNDKLVSDIERKKKTVERVRMERALLTEILESQIPARTTESEGTPSPPPTPQAKERPIRTKKQKSSNNEGTPSQVGGTSPIRGTSPGSPPSMSTYTTTFNAKDGNPVEKGKGRAGASGGVKKTPSKSTKGSKKPMNAYLLFCEEESKRIKARLPPTHPLYRPPSTGIPDEDDDSTPLEVGPDFDVNNHLAKTWRDLQPAGQKKYTDMANELQKSKQGGSSIKNEVFSGEDESVEED